MQRDSASNGRSADKHSGQTGAGVKPARACSHKRHSSGKKTGKSGSIRLRSDPIGNRLMLAEMEPLLEKTNLARPALVLRPD